MTRGNDQIVRSVITPNDQFLRTVFSNQKAYYIDIYQREYKWKPANVITLLQDIQSRFDTGYRKGPVLSNPDEIQKTVLAHFEPYFLNTYLTHTTSGEIFIVDGQQRLTTFLLIFISLFQILKAIESDQKKNENNNDPYFREKTFSSATLEKLIYESNDFGYAERFKIFNENREETFRQIVNEEEVNPSDETQKRISENFKEISKYFGDFFGNKDAPGRFDITKITYYITYILDRLSIVEIKIEKQENIATIFEVVNDRGLGLKPYEILKGKLLGNLPPKEKEEANEIWTRIQNKYFNSKIQNSTDTKVDLDNFFRTFFRAKFADSENDYEKFERDYHYEIYRNPKTQEYFGDFSDSTLLFTRIKEDIQYFADIYLKLRVGYDDEFLIYNKLLDQNQQYLLILSCLTLNDENEKLKISGVARKFDQFHTIMRLLDLYESNDFQRTIYPINRDIRNRSLVDVEKVFDQTLITSLDEAELLSQTEIQSISDLFTFERFQDARNRWTNFSKYVLMRIDRHLSDHLDKPSFVSAPLNELEERFNKTTRRRKGLHLEHIYAYNDANKAIFTSEAGVFDESQFIAERNRLGMVLLLNDKQNISSNNEVYRDKLDTYKKSNFIWNEMLARHLHPTDEKRLPESLRFTQVEPGETGAFPRQRVFDRQRLLFEAIKLVWCDFPVE